MPPELAATDRAPRRPRPSFPGAPRWVWGAALALLLPPLAFVTLPVVRSRAWCCGDCGAMQVRRDVLFLTFTADAASRPGQRLRERVVGRCAGHDWLPGSCEYSFGTVSCSRSDWPPPDWDVCALADLPVGDELVRRLGSLSRRERQRLWSDVGRERELRDPDTVEEARQWVAALARRRGWTHLALDAAAQRR